MKRSMSLRVKEICKRKGRINMYNSYSEFLNDAKELLTKAMSRKDNLIGAPDDFIRLVKDQRRRCQDVIDLINEKGDDASIVDSYTILTTEEYYERDRIVSELEAYEDREAETEKA